ncbi:hypothetical protein PAXINDRAFT_86394, partial [Paxillus involutus ATCC 200175]
KEHDNVMSKAVEAYHAELRKPAGIHCCSSRTVCKDFEQIHLQATGNLIKLSHSTLSQLASGQRSMAEAHAEKTWLSTSETKSDIAYVEEVADQGFPFSHWQLCEHVNEILTACLGSSFPGVGKCWTQRFITKYQIVSRLHGQLPLIQSGVKL